MLVIVDHSLGNVPVKLLLFKRSVSKPVIADHCGGKVPYKLLLASDLVHGEIFSAIKKTQLSLPHLGMGGWFFGSKSQMRIKQTPFQLHHVSIHLCTTLSSKT